MASKVLIKGVDELQKKLRANITLEDCKKVVAKNGVDLDEKMTEKAEFRYGYQTGDTKGSITLSTSNQGLTVGVYPRTDYSPYLEFGTRKTNAQPFVKPAFDEIKEDFLDDMSKLMI